MRRLRRSFTYELPSRMSSSNQLPSSARSWSSSSSESLSSIPLTTTSNTCPRCSDKLCLPPSIEALKSVFPSIIPGVVNRSIPRCYQCERVKAERDAYFAEFPEPTLVNPVTQLEEEIRKMKDFIKLGIQVDAMKAKLPGMEREKEAKEDERDKEIKRVWDKFSSVWGLPRNRIGS